MISIFQEEKSKKNAKSTQQLTSATEMDLEPTFFSFPIKSFIMGRDYKSL